MPSSDNVHFGKLRAAHVDHPHHCGSHSGPLRQGSPHVFVQNRPLVREKDLPPCAGRPDHEPAVHCHVGEGGGSAVTTQKQGRVQSAPRHKCTASGDPVDVATGRVFTSVFEFAGAALPGFPCESFYSTEQAGEDGPLGWGWSHSLMQHLEYDGDGLTFCDAEGRRVLFPPLNLGESVQHLDEAITLAQGNEGEFVLERADGLTLFFVDEALTGHARLQTVFEPGGQALALEYTDALLTRLADTLGNEYRVESDDGRRWHRLVWEAGEIRPEQALVRWEYDRDGNLLAAADALGQWRRFLYDASHRLLRNTDRTGYSFVFEYDPQGRCTRTHGQDGLYDLQFTYTEDPPQTAERDSDGQTTVYEYNDLGLVTRVTDPAGHAETFTYEGAHQTAHADALGRTTRYEYDPSGRVTEATAPGGGQSRMTYDEDGPASVSAPEGETVTRTETPDGSLLVTAPSASAPLFSVRADPDEGCLIVEDGAGQASRFFPDEAGRLLAAETPLGRTLAAAYDDAGLLSGLADGAGRAVGFQYDPLGRLTAIERAGGSGVRFAYDPEGSLTHFTDGAGHVTGFGYAGFQQLQSVTQPDGSAVQMEYDRAGRLCRLTDGRGSVWQFDYGPTGRIERLLHPDGASEVFGYDPAGQVIRRTARSGAGFAYDYDLDGNLTALSGGDGTAQTFAYDPAGRLLSASCPGSEASFEYDGLGRLTAETQDGRTLAYAYDPAGRLASLTLPSGEQIAYAYDADGALTEVSDWNSGRHTFGYDAAGALETVRAANGVTTRVEYSPLGQPEAVHLTRPDDTPLADIRLRCNANDALLEAHDSALGHARFEYDPAGRLVRASGAFAEAFAYDPAGNLTQSETPSGQDDYEYDRANRLLGGPFLQCRHDRDGHVTYLASPEGRLSLTYNAFGLLTRAALPTGGTAEYNYDALGRRTVKRVGDSETRFLWAGDRLISETITCDNTVTETHDFLYPPGSWSPLAQRINGSVFCCHTDHRGAPTRLTDTSGHLAWSAAYTAFGQAHPRHSQLRQPLRLPGQYHDEETGLHQNRWRSYDPQRGRYLSPDPLGLAGGLNLYAYAGNDPINGSDPLGLFPGIEDLAPRVLGAKTGSQASQAYSQVQNLLHHHLSAATPPFLAAGPSPFGSNGLGSIPGMKPLPLGVPAYQPPALPGLAPASIPGLNGTSIFGQGLNGPLPPGHLHPAKHHAPAHHAPPPAKAAHACAPKPNAAPAAPPPAAPARTVSGFLHNVPGSAKQLGLGVLHLPQTVWHFGGDIGTSLSDGISASYHRAHGEPDLADAEEQEAAQADARSRETVLNLVPFGGSHGGIAHYGEAFGDWATSLTLPPDQAAAMRQEGGAALHRANQYIEDMAYTDPAGFAANIAPLAAVGRAAALGRIGKLADGAEAASKAAAATGDAGKAARLGEQAARYREAIRLSRGGAAGAAIRKAQAGAQEKLSSGAKASLAKGKAAVAKRQAAKRLAKGQAAADALRARRSSSGHGGGPGQPALAHAGSGGRGPTSRPIGRPSLIQQMTGKSKTGERPTLTERIKANKRTPADIPPVKSTLVTYGDFDLSKKALEFRRTYKDPKTGKTGYWGTSNVAVFEYTDKAGKLQTLAVKSKPFVQHSEPLGLLELEQRGVSFDDVKRVYTERQPCSSNSKSCDTLLASELPGKPVFHSFEYGSDEASQAEGNKLLQQALRKAEKEANQ